MKRRFAGFHRKVTTNQALDSYADIAPLLSRGMVDDARTLLGEKYRIGPPTLFTKNRSVVACWLEKMGDLQYAFFKEERREERETIHTTYRSLGDLVKAFVIDQKVPLLDSTNRSLLHHAAYFQLTEICEFLLARKYDPNGEANGNETPSYEALTGFEYLPLYYDEKSDPFRVKELFRTLLDGGADPDFPPQSARSVNERIRTLTKWWNFLMENEEERKKADIPDLERKIGLLKTCYVDALEAHRRQRLRGGR